MKSWIIHFLAALFVVPITVGILGGWTYLMGRIADSLNLNPMIPIMLSLSILFAVLFASAEYKR